MVGVSKKMAGEWFRHFRQLITEMMLTRDIENLVLGGEDTTVEIDESECAKRKHNKGCQANGDCVFGMVERTPERKCAPVVVKDRTSNTSLPLVSGFIAPGSVAHSDVWGAHNNIQDIPNRNCTHKTLCHDIEFVAEDGTHTQTIEGNWGTSK